MTDTVLRLGGYQGSASVHTKAAYILARELAAGSGARLDIIADITKTGRNAVDLFDMVEGNELDICYFASSYLAHRVPDLAVFDLPFVSDSREGLYEALDGALGAHIAGEIEKRTGFCLLGYWDNGFRHFTNSVRPIRTPEDCRGLVIRTMASDLHQATFRSLGFHPVYIDVKDYPAAVRDGTVNAQENPLTNTINFDVHLKHKFVSLTAHFCGVTLVLGARARFERLPAPVRAAMGEAMRAATVAQRKSAEEVDEECLVKLSESGVGVLGVDEIDMAAFRAATADIVRDGVRGVGREPLSAPAASFVRGGR